ncbi:D-glucuronyl C5-epimerase family protein [Halobacterium salinarum]|uniref:D-glucuronyl C5-epimerase C-terminus n=1 Tax=Halobacterium salinarum (strain ATCC 33171 / DSM 3754 / JCM 8978 / NBRC 102687 / NCIMB 764 / 91-R6) TaxID=2597657 RepID=A0A4D6GQK8_HALS9|nr:D-glucuronyl C5-epimerase family protein [Halobacterium salinarum]QCC43990.1 glycoside hydrolase family protein [Halobacterium salinarum]TYO82488.1 D-glucuronyl C5-epimerase C-terminus [Halobacterium salinarum DSM 3754]
MTPSEVNYDNRPQWFLNPYKKPPEPPGTDEIQSWTVAITEDIRGESGHHPLRTTRRLGALADWYHMSGDEGYLEKAAEIADNLISEHTTELDGGYYFNYGFEFQIQTDYTRQPPWFSCMSQGTGLSAFLRLYEATEDQRFQEFAEKTYQCFLNLRSISPKAWVAFCDDSQHLWLSEYPEPGLPLRVLNGAIIGLWGPYEYWLVTGDDSAKEYVQAVVTTLREHAMEYRNPEEKSYYALTEKHLVPDHYHRLHIYQMRQLAKFANEPFFDEVADVFLKDRPDLGWKDCDSLRCE